MENKWKIERIFIVDFDDQLSESFKSFLKKKEIREHVEFDLTSEVDDQLSWDLKFEISRMLTFE
jgi:hypothetical protein